MRDRGGANHELRLAEGTLTLERTQEDFSPLHFSQRFVGNVTDDQIDGAWFMAEDHETWAKDFDLVYSRLSPGGNERGTHG